MKSYRSKFANELQKIIIVVVLLAANIVGGKAQYFVEGSVGVMYQGQKLSVSGAPMDTSSFFMLNVYPKAGYWINDHIALGINPFFSLTIERFLENSNGENLVRKTQMWGFAVFGRYKLLGKGKFSVFVDCPINIGGAIIKEKAGSNTNMNRSMTTIGIDMFPVVSYDLTDKFSIVVTNDFLSLGFVSYTIKDKSNDFKVTTNQFIFCTQSNSNILGYLSTISIGIVYKF